MNPRACANVHRVKMKAMWNAVLAGAVLFGIASALSSAALAQDASCGSKTNPCPLQKWMQDNVGSKLSDGNLDAVAASLDKVAAMSPDPTWTDWAKFAKDGAAAARKGGDAGTQGAKAACKSCHDKFKNDYKTKFRIRAVP
jgi:hypothetical protein